jgi:AcrR family transcriptional regulator
MQLPVDKTGEVKISALGETGATSRAPLTRQRVVAAAVEIADRNGIESISMGKLAQKLSVEAMSLYTHVRNKDDLLDGMVDAAISEIPLSADGVDWKSSLCQVVLGARQVVLCHTWVPQVTGRRRCGHHPRRPPAGRREHRQRFWAAIAGGATSEGAGPAAGVSPAVLSFSTRRVDTPSR